jgi:hypothetical protein
MRRWRKAVVAGAVGLAVLVPSGVALAATTGPGSGPAVTGTCTGDHQMLQLRDGSGWRHMTVDGTTVQPGSGAGHQHMSGPRDGSGPRADRAMDGTGQQWRSGSRPSRIL